MISKLRPIAFGLIIVLLLVTAGMSGCIQNNGSSNPKVENELIIFHHSSIAKALDKVDTEFKTKYTNTTIKREKAGSSDTIRKVTDLNKTADIVMSGDYMLIQSMMQPKYTDWWIRYSTNEIVLAYNDNSKYKDEITASNWYSILKKSDVRWGVANPNVGPDGYRAFFAIYLSESYYSDTSIFEDVVVANSAITVTDGSPATIKCPEDLAPKAGKLTVRKSPADLLPLLKSGDIDYAFQYYSDAMSTNVSGTKVLRLPSEINLGKTSLSADYAKVQVIQYSNLQDKAVTSPCLPIANGFTIPNVVVHKTAAIEYLKILLGQTGKDALTSVYIVPMDKAETNNIDGVPKELRSYVKEV